MSPLFGINPGTIMGAMWVQQREAERRHQELAGQASVSSGRGAGLPACLTLFLAWRESI